MDDHELRAEIIRLGPWHLDVEISSRVSTRAFLDAAPGTYPESCGAVSFIGPRTEFRALMQRVYPEGLTGRTVLDCGCNCGGYLFWAKELGAGDCFGFDARDNWTDQARFLAAHRAEPSDGIRFEVMDLYDLPRAELAPFDITIFKGLFYHLPDPITGLKAAADLTRDLILVNTATRDGFPDGLLALAQESTEPVMSGVHGLNWFPTGPEALARILEWMGFAESRCVYWTTHAELQPPELGRLQMFAARDPAVLAAYDALTLEADPVPRVGGDR